MDIAEILSLLFALFIGLASGSYATMPFYRLPNGIPCAGKWVGEKSKCPSCGTQLRTRDLVPVFNWLLTWGKCQFCKVRISPIYFFIEFTIALNSVLLYLTFGFDQIYLLTHVLSVCLVILVATDFRYHVMPDAVFVVMVMCGMTFRALTEGQIYTMVNVFVMAVLLALALVKLIEALRKKEVTGYSYLKFIAVSGLWLSHVQFFSFILLAGLFAGIVLVLRKIAGYSEHWRLGGALALALILHIFVPQMPYLLWDILTH